MIILRIDVCDSDFAKKFPGQFLPKGFDFSALTIPVRVAEQHQPVTSGCSRGRLSVVLKGVVGEDLGLACTHECSEREDHHEELIQLHF